MGRQRRPGAPQGSAPAQMHAIQRFGSSVNLHIHDHAVVSDGAFAVDGGVLRFYPAPAPSPSELEELTERLRRRILRRMKAAVPEAAILDMLAWPHSGFSLNASVPIGA